MKELILSDLAYSYPDFELGPIRLTVPSGILGLVGPNGAGKTTLLSAIGGTLPQTQGTVTLDGVTLSERDRRVNIASYASDSHLYPNASLRQHLRFLSKFYPEWDAGAEEELVSRFKLPLDKAAGAASSGTRSKFNLLLCFARQAAVLIFDEPWNTLDPLARAEFSSALVQLCRETDRLAIISSHDLAQVDAVATQVGCMSDGRLVGVKPSSSGLETTLEGLTVTYRKLLT